MKPATRLLRYSATFCGFIPAAILGMSALGEPQKTRKIAEGGAPVVARPIEVWVGSKDLPFDRTHAIVRAVDTYVVGGLYGLYTGSPQHWKKVDDRPIRDMAALGSVVWVLYGDGSVDKLDVKADRLYFDVLQEGAKRPWASCLAIDPKGNLLIGGMGGWMEKSERGLYQEYPRELAGKGITAILRTSEGVWLGTQKSGLYLFAKGKLQRFGFAAGLPDTWVTALASDGSRVIAGMADGGIVEIKHQKIRPIACPVAKVWKVLSRDGDLVVGGLDGAWLKNGPDWTRLSDREATGMSRVAGRWAIGTNRSLLWFK